MVLAWENLRRFLFIFVHFVVAVHLSSFVDVFHFVGVVSSFDFQATLLCHRHSTLASQTCESLQQLWALPWLLSIAFSFSSTTSPTVLSGHFLPTGIFYLTHLPDIFGTFPTFWHNLLLSRFHWHPAATFLKVAGLHIDPRNTDPAHLFVLFTVIHNLLSILSLYLCMSIMQKFYLWWKLDKISSHTIQQPWNYKAAVKLISNQDISVYLNCSLKKYIT